MDKNVALNLWVPALRSGNYKQCTGQLNDGKGGFCCLGVLLDLIGDTTWIKGKDDKLGVMDEYPEKGWNEHNSVTIPTKVRDRLGMKTSTGLIYLDDMNESPYATRDSEDRLIVELAGGVNDHGGTFAEIADLIEKYWEQL